MESPFSISVTQYDNSGNVVALRSKSGVVKAESPARVSFSAPAAAVVSQIQSVHASVDYGWQVGGDKIEVRGTFGSDLIQDFLEADAVISFEKFQLYFELPRSGFVRTGETIEFRDVSGSPGIKTFKLSSDGTFLLEARNLDLSSTSRSDMGVIDFYLGEKKFRGVVASSGSSNSIVSLELNENLYRSGETALLSVNVMSKPTDGEQDYFLRAIYSGRRISLNKVSEGRYTFRTPALEALGDQWFSVGVYLQKRSTVFRLRSEISNLQIELRELRRRLFKETNQNAILRLKKQIAEDEGRITKIQNVLEDGMVKVGEDVVLPFRVN